MFSMIFKSLMGPIKSSCDIPSGTTQGGVCRVNYNGRGYIESYNYIGRFKVKI